MIVDLFSKRQRRARGDVPDVYQYEDFPSPLRVQVVMIWEESFVLERYVDEGMLRVCGDPQKSPEHVVKVLRKEYGMFHLHGRGQHSWDIELFQFFLDAPTDRALDCVELGFRLVDGLMENEHYAKAFQGRDFTLELNGRMREAGVGYRFEDRILIRVDSEYLHEQAVKPALAILSESDFAGANAEFRAAHEHYRHGRLKECLVECLKCFESTMKSVCDRQGWTYSSKATASKLVDIVVDNGLLPAFSQSQLTAVRQLLSSGVPTVRNKLGGHGQGSSVTMVPEHLATYALNLTATTVRMIGDAEKALEGN